MPTNEELLTAAAEWLTSLFPANFTGRDDWVIRSLTADTYPTGWDGFVQDTVSAGACS